MSSAERACREYERFAGLEPARVRYSRGGIGVQLGQLKAWLAGSAEEAA